MLARVRPAMLAKLRPYLPFVFLALALATMMYVRGRVGATTREAPYSEVRALISGGKVQEAEIATERVVVVLRDGGERVTARRPPALPDETLLGDLARNGATVHGNPDPESPWLALFGTLLPFLLLPALFFLFSGLAARRAGKPMQFGQSKAKIFDTNAAKRATFADVAGVDEAKQELLELVSFLKEPARYREVGARAPKGVLLVGPPGTGKTLLARAVAGESGVPFFSISGSEFVEMFVGVGASRVRDLFEQAKERAPCIIFIDELDAIGKSRAGASGFAANEEREQTLNQLLVEMDGFDTSGGIVIMSATNRPEILDAALLRAGRFDRQVIVDRPDVRGREAILRVHIRSLEIAPDVDPRVLAQRTPGMVGADLANVVNEAALAAVRRSVKVVAMQDFEEAIDRLQLGLKKHGRVMTDDERRRVAYHEAGHALVAMSVEHSDPVHRVTIIPRSIGALGATLQLPTEERYLMTSEELRDRICVFFGGRAAEEIACGDVSTGAQDDLERATELARMMVCSFGMSEALGSQTFGRKQGLRWLGSGGLDLGGERNFGDETARRIDAEVSLIVSREHARARELIDGRRESLEAIARALLERETLQGPDLLALAKGSPLAPLAPAADEPVADEPAAP